jgi:Domain of unknown function (DU1801)
MAQPSTPAEYIEGLAQPRRGEIEQLDRLIRAALPEADQHFQHGMLGYGTYRYRYSSGREGDAALVSLSSRKAYISIYVSAACDGKYVPEIYADRLPNANIGKSCIRFKTVAEVDTAVLTELLREAARVGGAGAVDTA